MNLKNVDIGEILDHFNGTNIHIICQATTGFTTLGSLHKIDIDRYDLFDFTHEVNIRDEIGTLFPKFTISCFPVPEYNKRQELNNPMFYRRHILDAIELHRQHVKTHRIVFIFDRYGNPFNKGMAVRQLEIIASELDSDSFSYELGVCVY